MDRLQCGLFRCHFGQRLSFFAALLLSACGESWNWHQKLTVTVETPQGEKSGSAVQQVTWKNDTLVPGSPGGRAVNGLRGEAAVVELGSGRYLFALINGAATLAQHVVLDPAMAKAPFEERGAALEQVGRKGTVPRKYIPQLVTFSNIDNPASVKQVDPDNLAATFGPGYRLKSVTLEITDEPVTDGEVEKVLGWLQHYRENNFRLNG